MTCITVTVLMCHSLSSDVILNMVSNIAVNVLGGGPDMQGELDASALILFPFVINIIIIIIII